MKSPSQTNAIDFDSAKLQRLGFGQQPLFWRGRSALRNCASN